MSRDYGDGDGCGGSSRAVNKDIGSGCCRGSSSTKVLDIEADGIIGVGAIGSNIDGCQIRDLNGANGDGTVVECCGKHYDMTVRIYRIQVGGRLSAVDSRI